MLIKGKQVELWLKNLILNGLIAVCKHKAIMQIHFFNFFFVENIETHRTTITLLLLLFSIATKGCGPHVFL